jgi:integrase
LARSELIDGRRRSVVTLPGHNRGMHPPNYGKKFPAEPLTRADVDRLLRACGRGNAGARNRAIIVVMWRAGLRIAETLALLPHDVDLIEGTITVMHGKGDRRRVVGIDPQACDTIQHWIDCRRQLGVNGKQPLFCVISRPNVGAPVQASCFREAMKDAGRRAGLERRVHPHALRHTHATELAREKVPIQEIQVQLGHKDLITTIRYIGALNPQAVIDRMRARTW